MCQEHFMADANANNNELQFDIHFKHIIRGRDMIEVRIKLFSLQVQIKFRPLRTTTHTLSSDVLVW